MSNFTVEIISPAKSILKIETREVILPSFEGEMTILYDHISIITFLRPGIININENKKKFFVEEGTVEFSKNNLTILSSTIIDLESLSKDLTVPSNLNSLLEREEIGMFMLKLVEIIGSDEVQKLDPETLYIITNLLNKAKLKKIRNEILNLTLPLRV